MTKLQSLAMHTNVIFLKVYLFEIEIENTSRGDRADIEAEAVSPVSS